MTRLVIFSDGHIGNYTEGHPNALGMNSRLWDTLSVWDWILELAFDVKATAVIFAGDRFKPKRPDPYMRDLADARLAKFNVNKMPVICLVGNHDMYDKAGRWNSYGGAKTWADGTYVDIISSPEITQINGINFIFLPYGYHTIDESWITPRDKTIVIFHDEVKGVSNYGPFRASGGIAPATLDRPEFDLVLGGHIHLRQELPFTNTMGYHIGTPLERIEDGDQGPKGALIVEIEDEAINIEFVESPFPKIQRHVIQWTGQDILAGLDVKNVVMQLTLLHTGELTAHFRKELQDTILQAGAAAVQVRLQTIHETREGELPHDLDFTEKRSIPEQIIEWAKHAHSEDPKLLSYLERVLSHA